MKNQGRKNRASLLLLWIAFDDGFLLYPQRRLRTLHVLADGHAELSSKPSKFRFGFRGEWTATKVSNSITQLFNPAFARGGHSKGLCRMLSVRFGYGIATLPLVRSIESCSPSAPTNML